MSSNIKSGKEVIDEFFADVMKLKGVDDNIVKKLMYLYQEDKLTDTNVQNELDQLLQDELDRNEV